MYILEMKKQGKDYARAGGEEEKRQHHAGGGKLRTEIFYLEGAWGIKKGITGRGPLISV